MAKLVAEGIPGMNYRQMKESGADGVLFPVSGFSLGSAAVYRPEQIPAEIHSAKSAGLEVYLKINRMIHEGELHAAIQTVRDYAADTDGIYYCDPCIFRALREMGLAAKGVFEDDTMITSSPEAQEVLADGNGRCVISSVCSAEEVLEIAGKVHPAEVLVYGPLCLSKSRRKFLSSYGLHGIVSAKDPSGAFGIRILEDEAGTAVFEKELLDAGSLIPVFAQKLEVLQIRNFTADADRLNDAVKYVAGCAAGKYESRGGNGGFYTHAQD